MQRRLCRRRSAYPAEPRGLNPEEYPTLGATATKAASAGAKGGKGPDGESQDVRAWADDERAPGGPGLDRCELVNAHIGLCQCS